MTQAPQTQERLLGQLPAWLGALLPVGAMLLSVGMAWGSNARVTEATERQVSELKAQQARAVEDVQRQSEAQLARLREDLAELRAQSSELSQQLSYTQGQLSSILTKLEGRR